MGRLLMVGILVWCDVTGKPFHTGWWGILGLIGWSYRVCVLVYRFLHGREKALSAAWVVGTFFLQKHNVLKPQIQHVESSKSTRCLF